MGESNGPHAVRLGEGLLAQLHEGMAVRLVSVLAALGRRRQPRALAELADIVQEAAKGQ